MEKSQALPKHLGFIVDGNRRWARERNLPTLEGHRKGFNKVEKIAFESVEKGIQFTSFYLFSTENWGRKKEEVDYLMDLLRKNLKHLVQKMKDNNLRCCILGCDDPVPKDLLEQLHTAEKDTKDNTAGTICFCFNYGGKQEIVDAANLAKKSGKITIESLEQNLYHPEVPACDLIVRTSGEERISGFMLWRAAYSEFIFLKKYWPDISAKDLKQVLNEFSRRSRRFGH